jgi:nucleoside-diphosphate-sugar epimerase
MKKILVTGGGGYVGSVLVPELIEKGYFVKVLDLMIYDEHSLDSVMDNSNFQLIKGDIRDKDKLLVALNNIDCVIHLAAISDDPTAELDEEITKSVNYDAVKQLVDTSKNMGVERFICASSSSMYGIQGDEPATERSPTKPLSLYAKYKLESEKFVNEASSDDFVTVIIRPATTCGYSPRQRFDLAVNALTYYAYLNNRILVHGGQQRRPNVTMKDLVRLYIHLIKEDNNLVNGETFNAGFENLRIIDMAHRIRDLLKSEKEVDIKIENIYDHRDFLLSSEKLLSKIDFTPIYKIEDAVIDVVNGFKEGKFPNPNDFKYFNIKKMKAGDFK